jgi:diaminopimelate decarboxylase
MIPQLTSEQLLEAAHHYGTPLYVYHAERITHQFESLRQAFAYAPVRFFYAAKALTNLHILQHVHRIGADVDCSSINEVKLAITAGFMPQQILYTSNSVSFDEIAEARALGVHINIDSLSNLIKFAEANHGSYPVGIRIRPDILAGGNLQISTGHDRSKFGIALSDLPEVYRLIREKELHVRVLHIHTGSEIKDLEVFVKGLELVLETTQYFPDLTIIDLGGGFKVPYKPDEVGTDMEALGERLANSFEAFEKTTGKKFQVWFEPGKFLVSQSGYFLVRANIIKQGPSRTFVGVNSGFNHLIRPMFYDAYHKITNISHPEGELKTYNIVGNICETDTFAWDRELNEVRPNDIILFNNAGAYGFEMSSRFNSRCRPAEVLVSNGSMKLIRRRENLEDILHGVILD